MLLYKRQSVFIGLVLFMAGLLTACHSTPQFVISSPSGISVGITDDLCPNVIVNIGQQITWTNLGAREHIVRDITIEGKSQFDSGLLQSGDTFTFTFTEPQMYKYQCSVDGSLISTITVYGTPVPSAVDSSNQTSSSGIEPTWKKYTNAAEVFSSDQLGLCFSYPQGYTQIPYNNSVQIVAPDLPGTDVKGLFWLEISDSNNRTAEEVADQEMTYAANLDVGRWTVTLGGEKALVLDGMPGQELQRRVYIVHQQTLYILAFWPTRSENKAASDQMEALYEAITSSWAWSPCLARE